MSRRFLLIPMLALLSLVACAPPRASRIVVGCKNFTEQVILGELLAQQIESTTHERVERRFYLAGSYIAHQALVQGRIDLYPEYTGTALTAVLKQPLDRDPERVLATIRTIYARQHHVTVAQPLGFENTFAMVLRKDDAARLGVQTLSQAAQFAPHWKLGTGYEFESRPDGLPGLQQTYQLRFNGSPRVMDLGLLYRALASHQVDIVSGNSTDGPIRALGLVVLLDDKRYFPPYEAVPLVREDALRRHPGLAVALQQLAGKISAEEMQALNHEIDGNHRDVVELVREFRQKKGL
ncbi:glycine betaine ABC transporter substrate-binding protein [Terriglobus sp. 2YAB30_2]|uniref:glycine betaine ABC transporter substrate-binding protein n=1 Tax=Terriglobus sp. 2YAB30_2 TaxID=3233023 RepID=UPI003F977748